MEIHGKPAKNEEFPINKFIAIVFEQKKVLLFVKDLSTAVVGCPVASSPFG